MRLVTTAVCLALFSTSALSADFGIGISAKSDDGWIYVPIQINEKFRIEPSVRYQSTEFTFEDDAGTNSDAVRTQEAETLEIGIGAFRVMKVAESAQLYFGARVAYVDTESTVQSTTIYYPGLVVASRSGSSQDGYRIGPAIGFEYLLGEHFSIGGEASYSFLKLEGETSSSFSSTVIDNIEQKNHGTDTQLIFRYRF